MRERKVLVYCFPYPTKKHNEENLRTKYEALKEPDQNRPNKEVTIQFNVATSTLATWKKKQGKNLPGFSKFITEMAKSQSGNISSLFTEQSEFDLL